MASTLANLQAKRAKAKEQGFTLVELAIVLVIIGLIVGGVLVGQDLIRAAEIRATITDIESYNSAANTFRTKYNGYPGDLIGSKANQFGFVSATAGTDGLGDGDGTLENGGVAANKAGIGGENVAFWEHLSRAGYVKQGFNSLRNADNGGAPTTGVDDLTVATAVTQGNLPTVIPGTRMRETTYIHAHSNSGRNFFLLTAFGSGAAVTTGDATLANGVTVSEALNIDEKMDDGQPTGGTVQAVDAANLTNTATTGILGADVVDEGAAPAVGVCVNQGAGAPITGDETYNAVDEDSLNSVACRVRIRASF